MRPLHIGLLVIGATLASGLAVKMTQPVSFPAVSAPAMPAPSFSPPVYRPVPTPPQPKVAAPTVIAPQPPKPSPIPESPLPLSAPPAYAIRINKPKSDPIQVARVETEGTKAFPAPLPYETPSHSPAAIKPLSDPAPRPAPRQVTLQSGTPVTVRLEESLSSDRNAGGDTFSASLADPLVADGLVIAERGARVSGLVVNSQKAGRFNGTPFIELGLAAVTTSDGQKVTVATDRWSRRADTFRGREAAREAALIGGGAAIGASIGAMAAGEKGAVIGAGAGGLAGAGVVAAAAAKPVTVSSETIIRFRLVSAVTITEKH